MRSFITLEFDRTTKRKIMDIQNKIRQRSEKGRFKYVDNFHITLKFLGEAEEEKLHFLYEALRKNISGTGSLKLSIDSLGAFGVSEIVRTIYLGLSGEVDKLLELQKIVESTSEEGGFKPERRFSPHITIAQDVRLLESLEDLKREIGAINIDNLEFERVVIMKSEQLGNKRVYTPLYTIELIGG